jgi:hypothetical protein
MFRTCYSLFEWIVILFGLANTLSIFQKYINWVLRDYLNEFYLAYMDDILIYLLGSRKEYYEYI